MTSRLAIVPTVPATTIGRRRLPSSDPPATACPAAISPSAYALCERGEPLLRFAAQALRSPDADPGEPHPLSGTQAAQAREVGGDHRGHDRVATGRAAVRAENDQLPTGGQLDRPGRAPRRVHLAASPLDRRAFESQAGAVAPRRHRELGVEQGAPSAFGEPVLVWAEDHVDRSRSTPPRGRPVEPCRRTRGWLVANQRHPVTGCEGATAEGADGAADVRRQAAEHRRQLEPAGEREVAAKSVTDSADAQAVT